MISLKINLFPVQLHNNKLVESYINQLFGAHDDEKVVLYIYHSIRQQNINKNFLQRFTQMDQQIFTKLQIIQILACSLQLLHNDQVGFYDVTNMAEYIMLQWPKDTLLTEKIITEYIQLQKDTLFTTTIDKELARMFLYLEGYFSVNNIDISKIKDLDIRISYKQQNSQQKIDLLCLSQHQQDQQNIQSKNQTESMYEQNLTVSQYINYSLSDDSMSQLLQKPQLLSEFI